MDKETLQGLCMTCTYEQTCALNEGGHSTLLFCEEFDHRLEPISIAAKKITDILDRAYPDDDLNNEDDHYKGLCINCEDRGECKNANSSSGVWHCEQYR